MSRGPRPTTSWSNSPRATRRTPRPSAITGRPTARRSATVTAITDEQQQHGDRDEGGRQEAGGVGDAPLAVRTLGGEIAPQALEPLAHEVELLAACGGRRRAHRLRSRAAHAPDRRQRVRLPPGGREPLDLVQVDQHVVRTGVPHQSPQLGRRLALLATTGAVRREERLPAAEREAAHAGLLVDQRVRQAQRRGGGGVELVDHQVARVRQAHDRDHAGDQADQL